MKNGNVNVVTCPPCGESTAKSGVRGAYKATSLISPSIGPADHFLRKGGRKGFTLIELLVVVLIIGILAAVAVPQYQFATDKSRLANHIANIYTIIRAEKIYHLANGEYTAHLDELDIDFTKMCQLNGNASNMLFDCQGGAAYNLGVGDNGFNGLIHLYYCGKTPCNYTKNSMVNIMFYTPTSKLYGCDDDGSKRGEKLCNYIMAAYGN